MSRYAAVLAQTIAWLQIEQRGWGLVLAPPTEQREIAGYLATRIPGRPVIELEGASGRTTEDQIVAAATDMPGDVTGAFLVLADALDEAASERVLADLNGRRDRLSDRGVWVLVVSRTELARFQRHAGDIASVLRSQQQIAFIPRGLTDDELVAARAELHAYYQRRFGRLDLRGFIRAEHEDVSFAVEDIFQPLEATRIDHVGAPAVEPYPLVLGPGQTVLDFDHVTPDGRAHMRRPPTPLTFFLEHAQSRLSLIVGGPGAGKSFFLRWCALAGSRDPAFLGIERSIPVYIPLAASRLTPGLPALIDYAVESLLAAGLSIPHALASGAAAGRVVFLLDGLDEVGASGPVIAKAVETLASTHTDARILVTSRPTGLERIDLAGDRYRLSGLSDEAVVALLGRWCELYDTHRAGKSAAAQGRIEGEQLAHEILSSPMLRDLAENPLLTTIIAIVHRAGVRLPDHRVELYDRIVQILVERWNQVRTRDAETPPLPIRVPDAIRLLGPVALTMVETGRDGAIDEPTLRSLLAQQIAKGSVRGVTDADETLALFRDSLGLLVEQAPGVYGFLHKTLTEFLAAHEAVRTRALEDLVGDADRAFAAAWHEVIRLALGILGTIQANDERLESLLSRLLDLAHQARAAAVAGVPELLGAILADDPALTNTLATAICEELIPVWWFDSIDPSAAVGSTLHSQTNVAFRAVKGSWGGIAGQALLQRYGGGLARTPPSHLDFMARHELVDLVSFIGGPKGSLYCELIATELTRSEALGFDVNLGYFGAGSSDGANNTVTVTLTDHEPIAALIRHGAGALLEIGEVTGDEYRELPDYRLCAESLLVAVSSSSPPRWIAVDLVIHRGTPKNLLPNVLAAWRELAERYPDGPQPPASVEEAIAKYGLPTPTPGS